MAAFLAVKTADGVTSGGQVIFFACKDDMYVAGQHNDTARGINQILKNSGRGV